MDHPLPTTFSDLAASKEALAHLFAHAHVSADERATLGAEGRRLVRELLRALLVVGEGVADVHFSQEDERRTASLLRYGFYHGVIRQALPGNSVAAVAERYPALDPISMWVTVRTLPEVAAARPALPSDASMRERLDDYAVIIAKGLEAGVIVGRTAGTRSVPLADAVAMPWVSGAEIDAFLAGDTQARALRGIATALYESELERHQQVAAQGPLGLARVLRVAVWFGWQTPVHPAVPRGGPFLEDSTTAFSDGTIPTSLRLATDTWCDAFADAFWEASPQARGGILHALFIAAACFGYLARRGDGR